MLDYCAAAAVLNPADLEDVYWAGRTTLVTRRDDLPVYDAVFGSFFQGWRLPKDPPPMPIPRASAPSQAVVQVPDNEPSADEEDRGEQALLGLLASDAAVLRQKSFASCTPEELAAVRRLVSRIRLTPPRRRTRRHRTADRGRTPDVRASLRETMRLHGDPAPLRWRRRKLRLRPLILVLDVSGSMTDYSRALLQFAYSARRAAARVEVFCFGTRLTRITRELGRRRPDDAIADAAATVVDWDGGTQIGASLHALVRDYGRRGLCRGGIVVICSDGLDRGDPRLLATSLERLALLSHRVVWLNPMASPGSGHRPSTLGMIIAEPHIDLLLSGHDLASLESLAVQLPRLR